VNRMQRQGALSCSVVVPAYNSTPFIRQALESLLQQSTVPEEIIVVDNGSSDDTVAVVEKFGPPVRLLREQSRGASFARNYGIYGARGDLVAFLDADDVSLPLRIEKQRQVFMESPATALVFSAMAYSNGDLQLLGRLSRCENFCEKGFFGQLLERNQIGSTSVAMVRRSRLLEVGGFDVHITHNEEYDLWLRLASSFPVKYLDEVLVHYRIHGSNISHQREAQRANEKKALEKYSLVQIRQALKVTYPDEPYYQQIAIARILLRVENICGAKEHLEALRHVWPESSDAAFLLGVCYQLSGKNDKAVREYHSCLELNSNQAEASNNLGVLAAITGERNRAVLHFQAAIKLRQHYSDPIENLRIVHSPEYNPSALRSTLNTLRKELKPL